MLKMRRKSRKWESVRKKLATKFMIECEKTQKQRCLFCQSWGVKTAVNAHNFHHHPFTNFEAFGAPPTHACHCWWWWGWLEEWECAKLCAGCSFEICCFSQGPLLRLLSVFELQNHNFKYEMPTFQILMSSNEFWWVLQSFEKWIQNHKLILIDIRHCFDSTTMIIKN